MTLLKKNRFKPFYKQLVNLRENVQNRNKLLKFKRKKWEKLIRFYKRRHFKRYKFKAKDQTLYRVSKYPNTYFSYKKRYKRTLQTYKKFKIFYGHLSKKFIKAQIKKIIKSKSNKNLDTNINLLFLELFEYRLDTVLYRSKFSNSLRNARQLIVHNKILVNKKSIKSPAYLLKNGDFISIKPSAQKLIRKNFLEASIWPIPPKYLTLNYKTTEIIFHPDLTNYSVSFSFNLFLEKLLLNYYRR
jgi:small subunit ribosomal protein S4